MKEQLKQLLKDESGASLIEYVLIAGLISIAGWGLMSAIGGDLRNILTDVNTATTSANTAAGNGANT